MDHGDTEEESPQYLSELASKGDYYASELEERMVSDFKEASWKHTMASEMRRRQEARKSRMPSLTMAPRPIPISCVQSADQVLLIENSRIEKGGAIHHQSEYARKMQAGKLKPWELEYCQSAVDPQCNCHTFAVCPQCGAHRTTLSTQGSQKYGDVTGKGLYSCFHSLDLRSGDEADESVPKIHL